MEALSTFFARNLGLTPERQVVRAQRRPHLFFFQILHMESAIWRKFLEYPN